MSAPAKNATKLSLCPRCAVPLKDFSPETGVELSLCSKCKGNWLKAGQLARLLNTQSDFNGTSPEFTENQTASSKCPQCETIELEITTYSANGGPEIDWCPQCKGIWLDRSELEKIRGEIFAAHAPAIFPEEGPESVLEEEEDPGAQLPGAIYFALPLAALFGQLCNFLVLPGFFLGFFSLQFHELGHAFASWVTGRFAMPLFYGQTVTSPNRSFAIYAFLAIGAIATAIYSVKTKTYFLTLLSAIFLIAQFHCTFQMNEPRSIEFMVWGGVAGQFWISGLLIVAFYHKFPQPLRWDFWRFPTLIVAMHSFVDAVTFWRNISVGKAHLPVGTLLAGSDDKDGDMDRLLGIYDWMPWDLTHSYLNLAYGLLAIICAHYLFFAIKGLIEKARVTRSGNAP